MPEVISHKTYQMREFSGINEESFWMDINWQRDQKDIVGYIVNPFKATVIATRPHFVGEFFDEDIENDDRPKSIEDCVTVGVCDFAITSRKERGRTTVNLIEGFESYLEILRQRKIEEEVAERGLKTVDGELYVWVDMLIDRIKLDQERARGEPAVKQFLKLMSPAEPVSALTRTISRDYSQLTPQNAEVYRQAVYFGEGYKARDKTFREELFKRSVDILGGEPRADSPIAIVSYDFGPLRFEHQIEYREELSPTKVIDALIKSISERLTTRSKIGELVLAREYLNRREEFEAKGLVNRKFLEAYNPISRAGLVYIRFGGVEDRLRNIIEDNKESHYEQNTWVRREH